jgi:PleD family two-component response regulator
LADATILAINNDLIWGTKITEAVLQAGLKCVRAKTEREAMDQARQLRPSLILIDLGVGSLDIVALMKLLKQDPELEKIPVLGYTFHTDQETWQKGVAAGCDRVVARSALQQELGKEIARIKQAG